MRSAILLFLLAATAAAGSDVSSLSTPVYVLRTAATPAMDGIWQFNPNGGGYSFWRPLSGTQETSLSAFADRIVLQGATTLEFDLATGRLLRRYNSLAAGSGGWHFHGQIVGESLASRLGIDAGVYGFPVCPSGTGTFQTCGASIQPPGWDQPERAHTNYNVLLRRPLDPRDTGLQFVSSLSPFALRDGIFRAPSVDPKRGLIMFSQGPSDAQSSALEERISNVVSGQEMILERRQTPWLANDGNDAGLLMASTYCSRLNAFLQTLSYPMASNAPTRLITRSNLTDTTILDSSNGDPTAPLPYAMTSVPEDLPATYVQIVPAIGETAGANGTDWRSDVWIYNPASVSAAFTVRRVARPQVTTSMSLPPHGSVKIPRALSALGGGSAGDGVTTDALVIESPYRWQEQLTVYSRTYTRNPTGSGTYGQAVPAVPGPVGYSTHLSDFVYYSDVTATNSQFVLDERVPGRFRHNFGAVNDSDRAITIRFRYGTELSTPPSDPARERAITVAAHSVANVSIEQLFPRNITDNYVGRVWVAADAPLPVWLSMVDNLSGDATFLPFTLFDIAGDARQPVIVPAVAHAPGANGTAWQTDLYGVFRDVAHDMQSLDSTATFISRVPCGDTNRLTKSLNGLSGIPNVPEESVDAVYWNVFPDVATQFAPCNQGGSASGALSMARGSWMAGFTRTYTTRATDGGTFGELLPFYPGQGWPVQHFPIEVSPDTRVNVGFFNALDYAVPTQLTLYDSAGKIVAESTFALAPGQGRQDAVGALLGSMPAGLYGLTITPLDSPAGPGRTWSYVSTVDNATGDPTNWW